MPDINEEPQSHQIFSKEASNIGNLKIPDIDQGKLDSMTFAQISGQLKEAVEERKARQPELAEEIDALATSVLGPFMLEDPRVVGERAESEKAAATNARSQHNLAHALYYISTGKARPEYAEAFYSLVNNLDRLAASKAGQGANFSMWLNGARVEYAIIRALAESGIKIVMPNYSADSNETLELDVRGKVDLLAVPPGKGYMVGIDSKSDRGLGYGLDTRAASDVIVLPRVFIEKLGPEARELVYAQRRPDFLKANLYLSPDPRFISGLNTRSADHISAIKAYGVLNGGLKRTIMEVVNRAPSLVKNR